VHPEGAVPAAADRIRHDDLHLLRHHADIGLVAAVVAEAIEAKAVVELTEKSDVVLEGDVGPAAPATAAAPASAAAESPATAASADSTPPPRLE